MGQLKNETIEEKANYVQFLETKLALLEQEISYLNEIHKTIAHQIKILKKRI